MNVAAEKIEGNDHVLTEILILLPPKSIFRFMTVSKRWKDMIKDPFFFENYCIKHRGRSTDINNNRMTALFQRTYTISRARRFEQMNILTVCGGIFVANVPEWFGYFINSSNGLILSRSAPNQYYIINPVTKRFVMLPRASPRDEGKFFYYDGLMCRENTPHEITPNYIVVRLLDLRYNVMEIETYSSTTGKWVASTLLATCDIGLLCSRPPVVVNGIFHWLTYGGVIVYDPNEDKNDKHFQLIEAPCTGPLSSSSIISRCPENILWYGQVNSDMMMKLWKLDNADNYDQEWKLMYDICVVDMWRRINVNKPLREPGLEDIISWNPLVVLIRISETWFLYNSKIKSCHPVRYDGHVAGRGYYRGSLCPFFQSFHISSYNL